MEESNDSFWKDCCRAVDRTLDQGTIGTGFFIAKCLKNLREITTPTEWSKEYLFNCVANHYIRIYANQIGKRAGIKGRGVYFDDESMNKSIADGLVLNEEKLSEKYKSVEMELRAKRDAIDGQLAIDTKDDSLGKIYQEMDLETLTRLIEEIEMEADDV